MGAMLGCGGLAVGFSIYRVVLVVGEGEGGLGDSRVYARVLLSGLVLFLRVVVWGFG